MIKKEMWSHNKAAEQERAFKNATLKQPKKKGDIFAEMEEEQTAVPIQRDSRRYIKIEEDDESDDLAILKKRPEENRGGDEEFELRDIDSKPPSYKVDEEDGLTEEKPLMGEKDSNKKGKDKKKDKENGPKDDGPIYAKPDKSKKKQKGTDDEKIRLQDADDDSAADSWV